MYPMKRLRKTIKSIRITINKEDIIKYLLFNYLESVLRALLLHLDLLLELDLLFDLLEFFELFLIIVPPNNSVDYIYIIILRLRQLLIPITGEHTISTYS